MYAVRSGKFTDCEAIRGPNSVLRGRGCCKAPENAGGLRVRREESMRRGNCFTEFRQKSGDDVCCKWLYSLKYDLFSVSFAVN